MNPRALLDNLRVARRENPTWADRLSRLAWLYSANPRLRRWSRPERRIAFRFPPPVGELRLTVRDNGGSDAFILSEVFQHRYYDIPLPAPPGTVLDLGANVGFTAIFFARAYPGARIACVEPMPDNARLLRENLARNGVQATVVEAAVSVADGRLEMLVAPADYGHKVAEIAYGSAMTGVRRIEVDAVRVETLMERLGWTSIDLLKVDIEGYEGVLFGAACPWLRTVTTICIECHDGFGAADLRRLADRHGFPPPRTIAGMWVLQRAGASPSREH